jgi:site-specific DNA recombinase
MPQSTTPAIVTPEVWAAAQQRMASNTGEAGRNQKRAYLLRGLIWCGVCGNRMYSSPEKGGRRTYRCSSREKPGGACGAGKVGAQAVEDAVWAEVADFLRHPERVAAGVDLLRSEVPDNNALVAQMEGANKTLERLDRQESRLLHLYTQDESGKWSTEKLDRELARIRTEQQQAQATRQALKQEVAQSQRQIGDLDNLAAFCARVAANLDAFGWDDKRLALEAVGARVTVNGRQWKLDGRVPELTKEGVASTVSWLVAPLVPARRHC